MINLLFLCTGNSARSQMAEALLSHRGKGRFRVGSAGVAPAPRVHPDAIAVLAAHGISWDGRPKTVDAVIDDDWEVVITVCDHARESCPVFPGRPTSAHWGMPDPAAVADREARRRAFAETFAVLSERIDRLLEVAAGAPDRQTLERELRTIATAPSTSPRRSPT